MVSPEYDFCCQPQNPIFINHKCSLHISIILKSNDLKIGLKLQAKAGRTVDFMEFHLGLANKSKQHAFPSKLL